MGDKLSTRTTFNNFGKLLTISAVEESDEGKYMCTAKNPAGVVVHYFDVIVEGRSTSGANYVCVCFLQREYDSSCFDSNQHTSSYHLPEQPKWLTGPPQSQLNTIGSDVHIKCSVSGKPLPDITWRRNGEIFKGE